MDRDMKKKNLADKGIDTPQEQAGNDFDFEEIVCNPDFSQGCIDPEESSVENEDQYDI